MLERARQKKSIVKNFIKLENFKAQENVKDKTEETKEDDFDLLYGIENEQTQEMKDKI